MTRGAATHADGRHRHRWINTTNMDPRARQRRVESFDIGSSSFEEPSLRRRPPSRIGASLCLTRVSSCVTWLASATVDP